MNENKNNINITKRPEPEPVIKLRHDGIEKLAAALVFIALLAGLVVEQVARIPHGGTINTTYLGDLLYLAGMVWSFVKAVS